MLNGDTAVPTDLSVTTAKLAAAAVTAAKVAANTLTSGQIAPRAIEYDRLSLDLLAKLVRGPANWYFKVSTPLYTAATGILAVGQRTTLVVQHNLGLANPAAAIPIGCIENDTINNPAAAQWAYVRTGRTPNALHIEVQNVGDAATHANWQGIVLAWGTV